MEWVFQERLYTTCRGDATIRALAYRLKGRYGAVGVLPAGVYPGGEAAVALSLGEPRGAVLMAGNPQMGDRLGGGVLLRLGEALALSLERGEPLGQTDPARLLEKRGVLLLPALWGERGPLAGLSTFWQQTAPSRFYCLYDQLRGVHGRMAQPTPPEMGLIARLLASCGDEEEIPCPSERPANSWESRFVRERAAPALALGLAGPQAAQGGIEGVWQAQRERLLLAALL